MKVCFWGNQDNAGYRLCKWLRAKGVEAHLYMMQNGETSRSLPEAIDPGLKDGGYPEWIHQYNNSIANILLPDRNVRRHIEDSYDVLVVSGSMGMMSAYKFEIPMICYSTGPSNQGVIKMWDHLGFSHKIKWSVVRFYTRMTVERCYKVLVHYDPEMYSLARLGQMGKQILFGFPEDVEGNRKRVDSGLLKQLNQKYSAFDKVFLWLGRICFVKKESPMYKGTDKFLEGVERIIHQGHNIRVVIGTHGHDWQLLQQMVEEKGLSEHFEWVQHMPYWKLQTYLSIENAVVFDELTDMNCVSSGMFRESLSVGAILVRSYSPILTTAGYGPGCPVLHAETTDEVYERMREVLEWSSERFREEKARVNQWARRYLHWEVQIERLIDILQETVYAHGTVKRLRPKYE